MINVLLIGDRDDSILAHRMIPTALDLAAAQIEVEVELEWLPTISIHGANEIGGRFPHAIWCVPGSPYANMDGALTAIHFARTQNIPFLGTCGGFQHALIEYARHVLKIAEADHAESNPAAAAAIINKLLCPLVNRSETITFSENSLLRSIYDAPHAMEAYHCSFGLNRDFRDRLSDGNLRFSAFNAEGEVRALELREHPFFIGTLFQPERSAAAGLAHPLIAAYLRAAAGNSKFLA